MDQPAPRSLRALAAALGEPRSTVADLVRRLGLKPGPAGWDVAAVLLALQSRRRAGVDQEDDDRSALEVGDDPVEVARAALKVAAQALAALTAGSGDDKPRGFSSALESLSKTLAELRKTEAAYLALRLRQGSVLELGLAKAIFAQVGLRFSGAWDRLEAELVPQLERWRADADFWGKVAEERAPIVRAWIAERAAKARMLEVDELAKLIEGEKARQG